LAPGGDFFKPIRDKKATMATGKEKQSGGTLA